MALPGLSLPGLGAAPSASTSRAGASTATQTRRTEVLEAQWEWRFEVSPSQKYEIRLDSGNAELFGVELAVKQTYSFSGFKGAVFTWQGCQLEISGTADSEYAGRETEYAVEWLNVHGMLAAWRDRSSTTSGITTTTTTTTNTNNTNDSDGPRVLIIGPESTGKSSLARSLTAWAVRSGHAPTVINLDPYEGLLAPPGSLSIVTCDSAMDVVSGYGIGPMSGPTVSPMRTPLVYSFPYPSPSEKPDVFKHVTTRMAVSVMSKLEDIPAAKRSGIIIDTAGSLNDPKNSYDLIGHIVSEFSINAILALGSERLSSDMTRKFGTPRPYEDPVTVLRVAKPGGAVPRDASFMKHIRTRQIRQYFYGTDRETLHPHSHSLAFHEFDLFRARSSHAAADEDPAATAAAADDDDDDDDEYAPVGAQDDDPDLPRTGKGRTSAALERVVPSAAMTGGLVAIKYCEGSSSEDVVRDSAVMGFLWVAEVDEAKKRARFLSPHPQRWGSKALVWGFGWPEAVGDLVA